VSETNRRRRATKGKSAVDAPNQPPIEIEYIFEEPPDTTQSPNSSSQPEDKPKKPRTHSIIFTLD
jgi:hypothetical protein